MKHFYKRSLCKDCLSFVHNDETDYSWFKSIRVRTYHVYKKMCFFKLEAWIKLAKPTILNAILCKRAINFSVHF